MRHVLLALTMVLVVIMIVPVHADSWFCDVCKKTFYFDPRDGVHKEQWKQMHMAAHGSSSRSGGSVMGSVIQGVGNLIGQAIANAIIGNPEEDARLAELQRREAARIAEEARQREIARKEREDRLHNALLGSLMQLEGRGDLAPMKLNNAGGDLAPLKLDDDPRLRPFGTAFFGIGGSRGGGVVDSRSVEPRMRNAAYWAAQAVAAEGSTASDLFERALSIADGTEPPSPTPANVEIRLSEDGLLAFQRQNIAYRQARADSLEAAREVATAQWEDGVAQKSLIEIRKPQAVPRPAADTARQTLLKEAEAAARTLRERYNQSLRKVDLLATLTALSNTIRRVALRTVVDMDPALSDMIIDDRDPTGPIFRKKITDAYDLFTTGSTAQEKLQAKAVLEQCRNTAVAELDPLLEHWGKVQEFVRQQEPGWLANDPAYAELKAAERVADLLMKKGFDPSSTMAIDYMWPYMDPMLVALLSGKTSVRAIPADWLNRPSTANFTNPVREDEKRQRLAQFIVHRRREQIQLQALFAKYDVGAAVEHIRAQSQAAATK